MAAPRSAGAKANGDFATPSITVVSLADVEVPNYQRGLIERHVQDMTENWNPMLFRPPLLSRRQDGKLDIIDGQHTIEAIRRRGHDAVPAIVREGVDYQTEAATFADLNTHRKGLRPYEVWRSEVEAGRKWAVELQQVAERNGLKVAHERVPTALACIGECRRILRKAEGAALLDTALYVLTHAWDDVRDEANDTRVERPLVTGMVDLIERVNPKGLIDKDGWVAKLRTASFKVEGSTVKVTPRSWPLYVAQLIQKGKVVPSALQTGSGQGVLQGKALAILLLGDRRAATFYK
ncbi:MAG TPA: DUF6551 family protein [Nocardioides sp.]|nr:DUF6551 family protein [Nocardioides sp.]